MNSIYIILDKEGHPTGASTDYETAWAFVLKMEKEYGSTYRIMSVPNIQDWDA